MCVEENLKDISSPSVVYKDAVDENCVQQSKYFSRSFGIVFANPVVPVEVFFVALDSWK